MCCRPSVRSLLTPVLRDLSKICALLLSLSYSRDRLTFSKTILRKYIRECVVRDPSVGSPWIVRHLLAQKYGIPISPSEEVIRKNNVIKEGKLLKRKKVRLLSRRAIRQHSDSVRTVFASQVFDDEEITKKKSKVTKAGACARDVLNEITITKRRLLIRTLLLFQQS